MEDSSMLSPDNVEEILNRHLNDFHEDLMDVTLSEMMNQHLMMLNESDADENSESEAETLSPDFVNHPVDHSLLVPVSIKDFDVEYGDSDDGDLNLVDTPVTDQTFNFMSRLEREFDQQAILPGVPSLLEETIPMNNFADMTFMDNGHCGDESVEEMAPEQHLSRRFLPPVLRNLGHSVKGDIEQEQEHPIICQRTILSPLNIHQSSILDEFLKSLPPLPSSPELQGAEQLSSQPPAASVVSSLPARSSHLPSPIITSRERCQEILEKKTRLDRKPVVVHPQDQPSSAPAQTPSSASHESVFSTPLTSHPPTSSASSQGSVSTYSSPREDFPLSSAPTSAGQGSENATAKPQQSLVYSRKVAGQDTKPKIDTKGVDADQRPLDMIIIRPARPISFNAVDTCPISPWSSLSSASSTSTSSSVSSWSWSWPSSSSKAAEPTHTPSSLKQRDHKPRLPATPCGQPSIDIRSRSMSSLMKHQNGWLGFQVLDIRLVASGRNHIVVVTKSNQVYSCWETEDEQHSGGVNSAETRIEETLGRSTRTDNGSGFIQDTTHQPGLVEFVGTDGRPMTLASIVKLVCSDHGTFVLTENGNLWGWGSFEDSQSKRTSILKGRSSSRPIQVCTQKIVSVTCGRNHILTLNVDGDVISWGVNTHGQLGRKFEQPQESDLSPYFIENLPPKIIGIGTGKTFSFAWDDERLYGWGDNSFGQLGVSAHSKPSQHQDIGSNIIMVPKEISLHWKGKSIKQVQGGERHTVILAFSGLVIAMGNDDYGQLGVTSTPSTSSAPSPSAHISADPLDARTSPISSTWSKIDMELSNRSDSPTKRKTRFYPALVRIGPGVSEISCGDMHTAACSDSGQMYVWGQGHEGVVMIQNNLDPMEGHGSDRGSTTSLLTPGKARLASVGQSRKVVAVSTLRQASIALVGQDKPDELLTLRHVLHHGGNRYPSLYRRLDVDPFDLLLTEILTGEPSTHRIKVKTTTTLKPKEDPSLPRIRRQGFRSLTTEDTSLGPESWTKELIDAPDITDKGTVVQLAKMNYNSYTQVASPGWYDLEGGTVNSTFGWEEDGVRGHVFSSPDNSTLIIAIKGTALALIGGGGGTAPKDKLNDNLLFSCCCAKVDRTWKSVCGCNRGGYQCDQTCVEDSVNSDDVYYNVAMTILWTVQDMYPGAKVWLTGHSLGGGLTALLGLTFGVPTVTFEAPGDRLAAQRLHLPMPPAINWDDFPLYHLGHTADPVFQGICTGPRSSCYLTGFAMESKCHTGRTCVYDTVGEDKWRVDIRSHRLLDVIEGVVKVKDVPVCKQEVGCEDCKIWEFL
ncbi:putative lipase atg15 [Podila verticillata]|nr:putative lipase atg15 [Podila verticillata]